MDRLEDDLRDVLTSERRVLRSDLVSLADVHAGASLRRRRRTAVVAVCGAVVAVGVAVPVALTYAPQTTGTPTTDRVDRAGTFSHRAATISPETKAPGTPANPLPWGRARVTSVTATSRSRIVVLGALGDTGACTPPNCVRLAQSSDGGRTFRPLPVPGTAVADGRDGPTRGSTTGVRFGSPRDGWLFGDGLWATHDGGGRWIAVRMPGSVTRLEAARGTVWALVSDGAGSQTMNLYRSAVGTDRWTRVPRVSVTAPADLAVRGSDVVVIGAESSPLWVSTDGAGFTQHPSPCRGALASRLSVGGSWWATCVTGNAAFIVTSPDGVRWSTVQPEGSRSAMPNSLALGAHGQDDALLGFGPGDPLIDVSADGGTRAISRPPPTGRQAGYLGSYLAFTDLDVGYAIVADGLWRTEDGGDSWAALPIR